MRRLMVTRRVVPLAWLDAYDEAWRRLREQALSAGGRAWRFRSNDRDDAFLEFVEWSNNSDMEQITAHLREQLDTIARGQMDGWQESETQ